jgi:hypothetical protein
MSDTTAPPATSLALPSPSAIRDELQDLVVRDLLGPAGGPEEELPPGDNPRDRYLVGMLAAMGEVVSQEESDELAQGGTDGEEGDGKTETSTVQARTLFPSSLGLTVCVDPSVSELQVRVRWGRYERTESETAKTSTGAPARVWKRSQVDETCAVPLKEGQFDPLVPAEEFPQVRLRGLARKRSELWVVSLFLVNEQQPEERNRDATWLFQVELEVTSRGDLAIFRGRPRRDQPGRMDQDTWGELQDSWRLHRHHTEFAVGHGVSVHAEALPTDPTRATRISTRSIPVYEVPPTTPPTAEEEPVLAQAVLDMEVLAETPDGGFHERLGPMAEAYGAWLERQKQRLDSGEDGLAEFRESGAGALAAGRRALERIRRGLDLLDSDPLAAQAFRFANRAMALQRVHSLFAVENRRQAVKQPDFANLARFQKPGNRSWRHFQVAFILLNLPDLVDLHGDSRSHPTEAVADLLWFPTGGGKTEAYLGLTAFTLALRRLQGVVAGRSGEEGVAVLMRYTLRLLTLQQFQRAAALVCACERLRQQALAGGDPRWGREPFRLGLWVGARTTPNKTRDSANAVKQLRGNDSYQALRTGTPLQLASCPWCGHALEPGRDIEVETYEGGRCRTLVYCGDRLGNCPFSRRQSKGEGLPVLVVDEEIYRRLPALLIATVDKFAQMPWQGPTSMLFGRVDGHCPRHGFTSPDLEDAGSHPKRKGLEAVRRQDRGALRPPDLIIQDELHLISGPLGTLVGLYETAVDELCTWEVDGRPVRPKVIASTATIRRAETQIRNLFCRRAQVFPPAGLEVEDNFFSRQRPATPEEPGRRYLGVCAPGIRVKTALIRVYVAFMAAAQLQFERYGGRADPWMTLVGYFNSLRELGGMRRLAEDQVQAQLRAMRRWGLAERRMLRLEELTSRVSSAEIPQLLDQLEVRYDPADQQLRKKLRQEKKPLPGPDPLDLVLATNMLSVGVDVQRLGLLVTGGQPKTTAEYIQATSRVGRSKDSPGLVCTVFNWARPRDLSHYETFEHYHATFYQHVEALSVTPFAPRALDRGLAGVLVSLLRLTDGRLNPNSGAQEMDPSSDQVAHLVQRVVERARAVTGRDEVASLVQAMAHSRLGSWRRRIEKLTGGTRLGYKSRPDGQTLNLLEPAGEGPWTEMTVLHSLREVEPAVNLVLAGEMDDDPRVPGDVEGA